MDPQVEKNFLKPQHGRKLHLTLLIYLVKTLKYSQDIKHSYCLIFQGGKTCLFQLFASSNETKLKFHILLKMYSLS